MAQQQPITSKLAVVASLMDNFVRMENYALDVTLTSHAQQLQAQADIIRHMDIQLAQSTRRIFELEDLFLESLDRNEGLAQLIAALEASILDCPHAHSNTLRVSVPVARRLNFENEIIDLTTDEELTDSDIDIDDVEL